jgi:hypothetical protein
MTRGAHAVLTKALLALPEAAEPQLPPKGVLPLHPVWLRFLTLVFLDGPGSLHLLHDILDLLGKAAVGFRLKVYLHLRVGLLVEALLEVNVRQPNAKFGRRCGIEGEHALAVIVSL